MRLTTMIREAVLDITSGTTRAAAFALVLAAVTVLLGGADVVAIAGIEQQADRFRADGGSTLVYRLPRAIDGAACDGLRSVEGVAAAGAVRQVKPGYTPAALPREPIPTYEVSPAFGGFTALGDSRAGTGVLISRDVAETMSANVGSSLSLREGETRVAGVFSYPSDGRRPGFGYAVLVPSDVVQPYDECWVEAWPVSDQLLSVFPSTLEGGRAPSSGLSGGSVQGPQLLQLNASHGSTFDGAAAFDSRVTRVGPIVLALVGLVLGAVAIGRRKLEVASSRHAGVAAVAISLQLVLESLCWSAIGALAALASLSVLIAAAGSSSPPVLWEVGARALAAALIGPALGALVRTATIREAHLFEHFKTR